MNKHQRILLFCAGLFGAMSVALAALGSHALAETLSVNGQVETFGKAVDYAIHGAVALLAVVALTKLFSSKFVLIGGYVLAFGTLCFSGSLFLYTIAGLPVTFITPIGGVSLVIGWAILAVSGLFYHK